MTKCALLVLLTSPSFFSGGGQRQTFLDAYRTLVTRAAAQGVTQAELSEMVRSENYFAIPEGPSEREPFRVGLRHMQDHCTRSFPADPSILADLRKVLQSQLAADENQAQKQRGIRDKNVFPDRFSFILRGYPGREGAIAFSADSRRAAMETWKNQRPIIGIWDLETRQRTQELDGRTEMEGRLYFTTDGDYLYRMRKSHGRSQLFQISRDRVISTDNTLSELLLYSSGTHAYKVTDTQIRILDKESGGEVRSFEVSNIYRTPGDGRDERPRYSAAVSPDESQIAIRTQTGFSVHNLKDGSLSYQVQDSPAKVTHAFCFSPDERWLFVDSQNPSLKHEMSRYDAKTGELRQRFSQLGQSGRFYRSFSHDGKIFATMVSGKIRIHDSESGALLRKIQGKTDTAGLVLSPSGNLVTTVDLGGTLNVWDAEGTRKATLPRPSEFGSVRMFSPDEKYMAVINFSGNVQIWEIATGESIPVPLPLRPEDNATLQSISPDGRYFMTAHRNGTAVVIDFPTLFEEIR